jgi:hypothetical protein
MARPKGSRTGRCQGCNHLERVRIERLLAAGASMKGTARKFGQIPTEIGPQLRCGALTDQNELIPSYKRLKLFEEYSKNLGCQVNTAITAPQFGAIKGDIFGVLATQIRPGKVMAQRRCGHFDLALGERGRDVVPDVEI